MKNKVIALSLLITAMSVIPAFADANSDCTSVDLNNSNSNGYILKEGVDVSKAYNNYLSDKNYSDIIYNIVNGYMNNGQNTNKPNINRPNNGNQNTNKPNINRPNNGNQNTNKPNINRPNNGNQNTNKPEINNPNNSTNSSVSSYEKQVVDLVNAERAKNGLAPLALDSSLANVARTKSKDMASNNYFSHTSPTYGSAGNMLKQFGIKYTAYGENIASGQKTPQQVVSAWMNSSGHRANILSSDFTKIGVGYATNSGQKPYWTQMFIR